MTTDEHAAAADAKRLELWRAYCANPCAETKAAYFDYQDEWRRSRADGKARVHSSGS